MSVLPIYVYNHPVLRKKAKPVRSLTTELSTFVEDMFETMHKAGGIGLAANQVGSTQRVIVIDLSGGEDTKEEKPLALVNPEVIQAEGVETMEEGCLSIPGLRDEVERPDHIRVRFKDIEFKDQELDATGLLARVLQHEIDHINGVLFIDHLNIVKRKLLRGRLNKIRKGEVEVEYPVVSPTPAMAESK